MTDTLEVFGTEYTNVAGIKAHDNNGDLLPFIRPQGTSTITDNGTYDITNYASAAVSIPIVTYYTGSAAPSAALGSNGDIYLQS